MGNRLATQGQSSSSDLTPGTHIKIQAWWHAHVIPALGWERQIPKFPSHPV